MDLHGFVPIRDFRVKLPNPMYPYHGKEVIQTCHVSEIADAKDGWLSIADLGEFLPAKFSEINSMNVPGPIYGAETDTCATGPAEAPKNVLLDRNGQEFVFNQPSSPTEFRDVLSAAIVECFQGYGCDGDAHWTLSSIREWWNNRDPTGANINEEFGTPTSIIYWRAGLRGGLLPYLRVYAFYVENGRAPVEVDELPDI